LTLVLRPRHPKLDVPESLDDVELQLIDFRENETKALEAEFASPDARHVAFVNIGSLTTAAKMGISSLAVHNRTMPLAQPVSAYPTSNFGQPAVAISFALAKPGETVDDFQPRINSRGEWGQSRYGQEKVEMVLTEESVERLVGLLAELAV
jgi:hypothetical protein